MQMEPHSGSWAAITDECPITYAVHPGVIDLSIGGRTTVELSMSASSLRRLIDAAVAARQEVERQGTEQQGIAWPGGPA